LIADIVINGDLAGLKPVDRVQYYNMLCERLGLDPLTRPCEYIKLQGKLVLYARREATEQLRRQFGVSVYKKETAEAGKVYIYTAYVRDRDGREDVGTGAVSMQDLTPEGVANAIMKAETKAKRRATLSICGLGMMDETEIADIPPEEKSLPVDEDDFRKARSAIEEAIERFLPYLTEQYVTMTRLDVDEAVRLRDIEGLRSIYAEIRKAGRSDEVKQVRRDTKELSPAMAKEWAEKQAEEA